MKKRKIITSLFMAGTISFGSVINVSAFQPVSHATLIEKIQNNLPDGSKIKNALIQNPEIANWGANGLDLPYLQPGQILERADWADRYHYYKVGTFAKEQLKVALQSNDSKKIAFAAGWVTHITGDLACHGVFVNPECGVYLANKETRPLHKQLENYAEPYIFSKIGGNPIEEYNKTNIASKFSKADEIPFDLLNEVSQKIYGQAMNSVEQSLCAKTLQLGLNTGVGYSYADYNEALKMLSEGNRAERLENAFDQAKKHGVKLLNDAENGDYSGFTDRWNLDVGLSNSPMSSLTVTVTTGKMMSAGTDDDVYFKVELKNGESKEWALDKVNYNDFEYGDCDEYYLYINDINFKPEDVNKAYVIKKDTSNLGSDWYLKGFNVNINGIEVTDQKVEKWIDDDTNKEEVNVDWSNVKNIADPNIN